MTTNNRPPGAIDVKVKFGQSSDGLCHVGVFLNENDAPTISLPINVPNLLALTIPKRDRITKAALDFVNTCICGGEEGSNMQVLHVAKGSSLAEKIQPELTGEKKEASG